MNKTEEHKSVGEIFVDRSRRAITAGVLACMILVGGFGGWAATAKLSGAVVTPGQVVVSSDLKSVQHDDGGIVGAIKVANGDHVAAGDVVLRLDDKLLRANRAVVDDQLIAQSARLARLVAERDRLDDLALSDELQARVGEPMVDRAVAGQQSVMDARSATQEGEAAALQEQIAQIEQDIAGLEAQRVAKDDEIKLIDHELDGLETLFEKGLTPETRITALKRERTGLMGSSGSLTSQIAIARGRISETKLRILQLEKSFREQVMNEISSLVPEIGQLQERRDAADLKLSRVDVRAPVDGFVHELSVHTVGGVVAPGDTLMKIVPEADGLEVTALVAPKDINHIKIGQDASLVIGAFDQKTLPRLHGDVTFISPDLRVDPMTGLSTYEVRVQLDEPSGEILSHRELALLPGMPAEVYIQTGERTMVDYLLEPLSKEVRHTFREP